MTDARALATQPWYAWFSQLESDVTAGLLPDSVARAAIAVIAKALGSPDGTVEKIPAQSGSGLTGGQSVLVNGKTIVLRGDSPAPPLTSYYGSGPSGQIGYQAFADALVQGANITLGVGADGRVTVNAADSSVPFFVPTGTTYTVEQNKQALFALPIELEGDATLILDGVLVEVN